VSPARLVATVDLGAAAGRTTPTPLGRDTLARGHARRETNTMYALDPTVAKALHEYRRERLAPDVHGVHVRRDRRYLPRIHIEWPPWTVRVRRKTVARQSA